MDINQRIVGEVVVIDLKGQVTLGEASRRCATRSTACSTGTPQAGL
jgi:hypothetical protein